MGTFIHIEHGAPRIVDALPAWTPHRLAAINRFWADEHAFSSEHEYAYQVKQPPQFSAFQKFLCHLVAYRVRGPRIEVVAVAHQRRKPGYWKGR